MQVVTKSLFPVRIVACLAASLVLSVSALAVSISASGAAERPAGAFNRSVTGTTTSTTLVPSSTTLSTSTSTTVAATLPSTTSDGISVQFPVGTGLNQAISWLNRLIANRENVLTGLQAKIGYSKSLSGSERSQLLAVVAIPLTQLSVTAAIVSSDLDVARVVDQATTVIALQIYNLTLPQVNELIHIDSLLAKVAATSSQQSAAAAAIAISNQSSKVVAGERTLDNAALNLLVRATTSLQSSQHLLLSLSPSSTAFGTTLNAATTTMSTESKQLKRAQQDLEELVNRLAGH